jgi:acylphosphatase
LERLHAVIHGAVQGVGFRYFVLNAAGRLGLRGWVRNNDDGTVEFVAEGSRAALERLRQAAEIGPRVARVDRVDAVFTAAGGGFSGFNLTD